jgi:multidrug efflux pump subunit AcrA (membrane-fusion protein)
VFVVDKNNVAATRTVATGPEVNGMTVIDRGLTDGDVVVVDGQSRLNPGSKVSVLRESGDTTRARAISTQPAGAAAPQ